MTSQNIESELSYAYLHTVCSKAGLRCKQGDRHDDGAGVDAEITYRGPLNHPYVRDLQLNVQLKATTIQPAVTNGYFSYFLHGIKRYDKLRANDSFIYKILVVLFLPENSDEWLKCSTDELIMKRAAYWVNLYGAPSVETTAGTTVYIPTTRILSPESLIELVNMATNKNIPTYKTL
jgi:hypothetical protein